MNPITRIFKNKAFSRFAKKADIKNCKLCKAFDNAENGLIDANLGGGVIKQRIAREGECKSGRFRVLILLNIGNRTFFIYGFTKKEL